MTKPPSEHQKALIQTRHVTAHEKQLWRYVVRHDAPLHAEPFDEIALSEQALDVDGYAADQKRKAVPPAVVIRRALPQEYKMLQAGVYHDIDKRTAMTMKRGKMKVQAVLDLHGLNQLDAFEQLQQMVTELYHHHKRMALVITGKGEAGQGVLRSMLPMWLNAASIRPYVLAFDQAQPKDGGQGAWYVFIKRQRKQHDQ